MNEVNIKSSKMNEVIKNMVSYFKSKSMKKDNYENNEDKNVEIIDEFNQFCNNLINENEMKFDYIEAMINNLLNFKEDKKEVNEILETPTIKKLFKSAWQKEDYIKDFYPCLKLIHENRKFFTVAKKNCFMSLEPESALYGVCNKNGKGNSVIVAPLNNECIISLLEVIKKNRDFDIYENWIAAIIKYDNSKLVKLENFKENDFKDRTVLKKYVLSEISHEKKLANKLRRRIFNTENEGKMFFDLIAVKQELERLKSEKIELEKHLDNLEKNESVLKNQLTEEREKNIKEKYEKESEIFQKIAELNMLKNKLKDISDSELAQRLSNERLVLANEIMINKIREENLNLANENSKLKNENNNLSQKVESLDSDISLFKIENSRLLENIEVRSRKEKVNIFYQLMPEVNQNIQYLYLYYESFKKENTIDVNILETYFNVIRELEAAFENVGLKKLFSKGEIIHYDSNLCENSEGISSNGDKVYVEHNGWKFEDEIIVKAMVREEE